MTKQEYTDYQETVARYLEGLEAVSTGPCPDCAECGEDASDESWFSWSPCEICHGLAGDRYYWHALSDGELIHGTCCADCMYYLNNGRLDDTTMLEIEKS